MKKGQIYILAVIIIGFLIYTIITPTNFIHQKVIDDDFEELSKNYQIESSKLLNSLLNQKDLDRQTLNSTFLNFTVTFTSYSKTKNPNFGIIYAFPFQKSLFIGNYADVEAIVKSDSTKKTLKGCFNEVSTSVSLYGISIDIPDINPSLYSDCVLTINYPSNNLINLTIEDIEYSFSLNENRSDIIIVSREALDEDVKVFISEEQPL